MFSPLEMQPSYYALRLDVVSGGNNSGLTRDWSKPAVFNLVAGNMKYSPFMVKTFVTEKHARSLYGTKHNHVESEWLRVINQLTHSLTLQTNDGSVEVQDIGHTEHTLLLLSQDLARSRDSWIVSFISCHFMKIHSFIL